MIQRSFDLQAMAAVLRQGRTLDATSRGIAGLTLLWWILRQLLGQDISPTWTAVIVIGLVFAVLQLYWAIRVGLDAELLSALAQRDWATAARDLDASLAALGLRSPTESGAELGSESSDRDWNDRWRGARAMLVRQGLCVVAQLLLLVAAGWVG